MRHLWACVLAIFGGTAGAASASPREDAAAALVDLFADTCVLQAGDVGGLRTALAARGLQPMPAAKARALLVWPGLVFPEAMPAEHLAVLSFDNGLCGTIAEDVDPGTLLASLARAMQTRGIAVAALGTAPAGAAQAYTLLGPKTRIELMVDIEPSGGLTQASMLAKPLPAAAH